MDPCGGSARTQLARPHICEAVGVAHSPAYVEPHVAALWALPFGSSAVFMSTLTRRIRSGCRAHALLHRRAA
jgi:hypothetical protein